MSWKPDVIQLLITCFAGEATLTRQLSSGDFKQDN